MPEKRKAHWEKIYTLKSPEEVSWTQKSQEISLSLLTKLELPKTANIIDVGGGDSSFAAALLDLGYHNITVVDISEKALEKAKLRLGDLSKKVTYIVADITDFQPTEDYDLWHDRAVFHFLTSALEQEKYLQQVAISAKNMIVGTFSKTGPLKCSGLTIQQYSKQSMAVFFSTYFKQVVSKAHIHTTPFGTSQDFIFGVFKRV